MATGDVKASTQFRRHSVADWGYRVITGQHRGPAAALTRGVLRVASWGYGVGLRAIRGAYAIGLCRSQRLPCPVVSVGNLTWGGTGKTPLTAHLANALARRGLRVAILTRGYGGDEPLVLRRLAPDVPVFIGADRVETGRCAIRAGADMLLMDDGFQQWRVHRDLDLVLLDAQAPFGNGALLPRGTLREPRASLRRADVVVVTKADAARADGIVAALRPMHPAAFWATARYRPDHVELWPSGAVHPVEGLRGRRVCVLSGIADPAAFEALVARLGVIPVITRRFLDHHRYTRADCDAIAACCRQAGVGWIVTTLKDLVRWPATVPWDDQLQVAVLHVAMDLTHEDELLQRLVALRRR